MSEEAAETILDGTASQTATGTTTETTVTGTEQAAPAGNQTAAPAAFEYGKMLGSDGAFTPNWKQGLPESIRNEKCLDNIKNVQMLAQSYVYGQKAMGANKIAVPTANSSPEEWANFYKAGGMPEKADDYKTDGIKLPEGVELDPETLKQAKAMAHENGISQRAFEKLVAFDAARVAANETRRMQAQQAEYNDTLNKLKNEFGGNFETVVAQCNKTMETFGLTEWAKNKGLLNDYTFIKTLAGMGERMTESKLVQGDVKPASGIDEQINAILSDPKDAYFNREHPAHAARVAEMNNLLAIKARMKK